MTTILDSIPADKRMVMTEELQRLFRVVDCEPECHACAKSIGLKVPFKLIAVRSGGIEIWTDQMVCGRVACAETLRKRANVRSGGTLLTMAAMDNAILSMRDMGKAARMAADGISLWNEAQAIGQSFQRPALKNLWRASIMPRVAGARLPRW